MKIVLLYLFSFVLFNLITAYYLWDILWFTHLGEYTANDRFIVIGLFY